jgi:hypothetical protein
MVRIRIATSQLVAGAGQRFESARRLFIFASICRQNTERKKRPGTLAGPNYTNRTLTCLRKCAVHSRSGFVLHSCLHVAVDTERHAEAGMAQGVLDDLGVDVLR